jgi:hypothetical protein
MKIVLRIALAALAIAGFTAVETPGQAMPVQAALIEFCDETSERSCHAAASPGLRLQGGTWQPAPAADAPPPTRSSSLHALCFVEQQPPSFITMNKQRPVVRYLTLRSSRILLRC